MWQRLEELRKTIEKAKGIQQVLQRQFNKSKKERRIIAKELRATEDALSIVVVVGEELQKHVSVRLSSIATYALKSIFQNPYAVNVEFSPSERSGIDAAILFERDGQQFKPVLPSGQLLAGGGPVEVAAWGIRCGLWAAELTSPVLLMDEPFRFLQKTLLPSMATIMQEMAETLAVQFIYITHEQEMAECADQIINLSKIGEK